MTTSPTVVTLHIWGVRPRHLPRALFAMAAQRRRVRAFPGVTFAKLMGSGSGDTFTLTDTDSAHWALLTCWDASQAAAAFERSRVVRGWDDHAYERLRLELTPLASTGLWSGRAPFGEPESTAHAGPVAALTRARLRPHLATKFWRAVPPVSTALHRSPGLALALGIGEAPIGLQGTFSVWQTARALRDFAYRDPDHRSVIAQTKDVGWYAEELFARFAVEDISGTYRGRAIEVRT